MNLSYNSFVSYQVVLKSDAMANSQDIGIYIILITVELIRFNLVLKNVCFWVQDPKTIHKSKNILHKTI